MATGSPDFALEARPTYAFCRYSGPFQTERLVSAGPVIAAFCAEHKLDRALIDLRESEGDLTVDDRFRIANYASYDVPASIRVAICIRPDQGDGRRIWSTAMQARGFHAESFFDEEPAIEWLHSSRRS